MKATINSVTVEGTPQELADFYRIMNAPKLKENTTYQRPPWNPYGSNTNPCPYPTWTYGDGMSVRTTTATTNTIPVGGKFYAQTTL